jgi:ribosome maturation factor RimP
MKTDPHKIESLITPIVEAMGCIVWHVELHRAQRKTLLRIYVDVPPGDARKSVNIDDCGRISNQIGALLDVEEPMLGSYILEVSSPGLGRSLFKLEHYERYIGSMVHVVLCQSINERRDFTGKIEGVVGNTLKLLVGDQVIDIELVNISRAKLISDL